MNSFNHTMLLCFNIRYKYSQAGTVCDGHQNTNTGETFPGNYTIIPSSKKWVFHSIFRLAFLSLYGEHVCSMNRLVLTDEEDAEYRAFETMIEIHDAFCSSKVMLCTFHAIWQPFKWDLYNLLPSKKSPKGKVIELTDVGKLWDENLFVIYIILYHIQKPISNSYLSVTLLLP
jgi:hypothetical protein